MKTKKLLALLLALVMVLGMVPSALAAGSDLLIAAKPTIVYASVVNGDFVTGKDGAAIAHVSVAVTGEATIDSAFAALHEQYYEGTDGYVTADTQWGKSVTTFWGIESASVGYYHNGTSAMGLDVAVADGDCLTFFFYQDTTAWSDLFASFGAETAAAVAGTALELTLTASNWEGSQAVAGASITVDGAAKAVTDAEGKVKLTFDKAGTYLVSAKAPEGTYIVAPVCVVTVEEKKDDTAALKALMDNIAAGYTESIDPWVIMDMAAYGKLGLGSAKTSDAAKQAYIDAAIASMQAEGASDTVYAKAILGLSAVGVDVTKLYPAFADSAVNAVLGLNRVSQSASGWCAPYTFAAYNQGNWGTDSFENTLIDAVLAAQGEDGAWSEWGDSVQTTSNMITGLAFYKNQSKVKTAIDKALAFLSSAQAEDGTWDAYGYGPDCNAAAMVVIALAANGVNPDTDSRFIKNGVSALDFLLNYAYEDNTGFGYQSSAKGGASDAYATEQAFRASVAAYQVMKTGKAFNVYDFSAGAKVPAYQSEVGLSGKHADVKKVDITVADVSFSDIAGHENEAQIKALAQRAVINGKEDGSYFDPDADMTRAEFATIVVKALGLTPAETDVFSDVPAGKWYSGYVGTAHTYGIVNGKGDGSWFDPFGTISRQEAACMVARAARLAGMTDTMDETAVNNMLAQFGDYTDVAKWAKDDVAFCYDSNILDQMDLDIKPATAILRCEIAEMLYNMMELSKLL